MKIVLDLDGVVANFDKAAIEHFGPCDQSLYNLKHRWPEKKAEIDVFLKDPATYLSLEPIAGAFEAVERLAGTNQLYAVSARSAHVHDATRYWLEQHGFLFHFNEVHVVGWAEKTGVVSSLLPDLAIDDSPYQVNEMRQAGIAVAVFDAPYNKDVPGPRINGWAGLKWIGSRIDAYEAPGSLQTEIE